MNNAGVTEGINLLVILNDNDMSISPPVGALNRHLAKIMSGRLVSGAREKLKQANAGKRRLKPVIIVETGEVFPGTKECAQHLGVTRNAVTCNINGKTELTRGYHIKYA